MSQPPPRHELSLDRFCMRQFDKAKAGASNHIPADPAEFAAEINRIYEERKAAAAAGEEVLVEGYAPFCKHLFVPNFVGDSVRAAVLEITDDNRSLLQSKYEARTEQELPVLVQYFPKDHPEVSAPPATHLDIILYSREQIVKENEAMGAEPEPDHADMPWGIISVKPQTVDFEQPMQPITMLRNALGKEEGGSGVPLDRAKYMESVAFWSKHATIA